MQNLAISSFFIFAVPLAYLLCRVWLTRDTIDRYSPYWLLLLLLISALLCDRVPFEDWPVGPVLWIVTLWCWLRLLTIWFRREQANSKDLGVVFGGASAGLTLLIFIVAGYNNNEALSNSVMIASQIVSALILASLFEISSHLTQSDYRNIILSGRYKKLSTSGILTRVLVLSAILIPLLVFPMDLLGTTYAQFKPRRSFPLFDAGHLVFMIWANAFVGSIAIYGVLKLLYMQLVRRIK